MHHRMWGGTCLPLTAISFSSAVGDMPVYIRLIRNICSKTHLACEIQAYKTVAFCVRDACVRIEENLAMVSDPLIEHN